MKTHYNVVAWVLYLSIVTTIHSCYNYEHLILEDHKRENVQTVNNTFVKDILRVSNTKHVTPKTYHPIQVKMSKNDIRRHNKLQL
ncbi:hypothetical protein [uncultured Psychroserpens sp.]|uniref:hypothetical protein n=1 Tax=uncultured Psychroserpens sp. TaxID=255436 RepID=UPI00260F1C1D|nr:hypothetical protein [uncultured Psychroserpens sp.]